MNRHRSYTSLDDLPEQDGDGLFLGVNARLQPGQLAKGEVAYAVNMRFDSGRAETRKGIRTMGWGLALQNSSPDLMLPYGPVARAESFNDPITGYEWMLIVRNADDDLPLGASYRARPGNLGTLLNGPNSTNYDGCTDLIQTYNGMVMLRGAAQDPLYLSNIDEGWKALPVPVGTDLEDVPPATQGLYFANRLFVLDARTDAAHIDSVWVSDIGGVTSVLQGRATYYQSFKINQGSADRLKGIAVFNDTTLVCAKARSIYAVSGIYGTNEELAQNARLDLVTNAYGCVAPRSFVRVGNDLWFLGHRRGVCSVQQTVTNALQGVDVPVSQDIQPLIDRINWEYAENAVAAVHDNRVYFAIPLDTATDNNAVLVYSTLTKKWAGYDLSDATAVRDFVKFTYAGAVRLGFLSIAGSICLYEDGFLDHTADASGHLTYHEIVGTLRTRGYASTAGLKSVNRLGLQLRTLNTAAVITAIQPGVAETQSVYSLNVDNTQYVRPYGRADWVASNAYGDHGEPWREDYGVDPDGIGAGIYVTDIDGAGTILFDQMQTQTIQRRVRARGEFVQMELVSSRGRLELAGIAVDADRGRTTDGMSI